MARDITSAGATLVALLTGAIPLSGCDGVNPIGSGPSVNGSPCEELITSADCGLSFCIRSDGKVDYSSPRTYHEYLENVGDWTNQVSEGEESITIHDVHPDLTPLDVGTIIFYDELLTPENARYTQRTNPIGNCTEPRGELYNELIEEFGGFIGTMPDNELWDRGGGLTLYLPFIYAPAPGTGDECSQQSWTLRSQCYD